MKIQIKSFVRVEGKMGMLGKTKEVKVGNETAISENTLPDECEFYFFNSLVLNVCRREFLIGPKMHVSKHFFKVRNHYTHPDYFRVYHMRCFGFDEKAIWQQPTEMYEGFTTRNFPNGVVIINDTITNPGKKGVIISAKEIINDYHYPSAEEIKLHRNGKLRFDNAVVDII